MNSTASSSAKYLLLQIRNSDDPMRHHEIESFADALECDESAISICDLLNETPTASALASNDVVLVGGSGDYSVTRDSEWLSRAFDSLRDIHSRQKPMFCSCWGFQAIARAFGGTVVHDLSIAELGTKEIDLTEAGLEDAVFSEIGSPFVAPIGHEDTVTVLPENCTLLGRTELANHVLRFDDAPIYATQFHPELNREGLIERIRIYPKYVEKITNSTFEKFVDTCRETPQMPNILRRFVAHVLA